MNRKLFIAIFTIFISLTVIFYELNILAPQFHFLPLEAGNIIMATLSLTTWMIVKKQMDEKPQAFIRGVYSATFMKLMVCMISVLAYVLLNKATLYKPIIFILFGIYIVYSIMESWLLMKLVKEKK